MRVRSILLLLVGPAFCAKRVVVLRHCPRAPGTLKEDHSHAGFTSLDNYTDTPFPPSSAWGSAPMECTPFGIKTTKAFGVALRELLGAQAVIVTADNISRCIATAHALAHGFGLPTESISVNSALFDPAKFGVCKPPTVAEQCADTHAQLERVPPPGDIASRLRAIQAIGGNGSAPALQMIPSSVSSQGNYVGGVYIGSEIVETFELEAVSGLPPAWNRLSKAELYKAYLDFHVYYMKIAHGARSVAQRKASNVLARVLAGLRSGSSGTDVLVGHDTTLVAMMELLTMSPHCAPLPVGATPPLGGLVFALSAGAVEVEFLVPMTIDAGPQLEVLRCPSKFETGSHRLSWADFSRKMNAAIDAQCVSPALVEEIVV